MLVLDLLTRGSTWRVDGCTPARRPTADTQTNHTTRFERLRRCDQLHHSRTCTACMAHGMPRIAFTAHHSRYACTTAQHARYAPYQSSRATRPVQRSPCNVTHAADVVRRATGENTACSMHQATNRRPTGDRLLPPACPPTRHPGLSGVLQTTCTLRTPLRRDDRLPRPRTTRGQSEFRRGLRSKTCRR